MQSSWKVQRTVSLSTVPKCMSRRKGPVSKGGEPKALDHQMTGERPFALHPWFPGFMIQCCPSVIVCMFQVLRPLFRTPLQITYRNLCGPLKKEAFLGRPDLGKGSWAHGSWPLSWRSTVSDCNIGALRIKVGLCGPLYYKYDSTAVQVIIKARMVALPGFVGQFAVPGTFCVKQMSISSFLNLRLDH